MRFSHTSYETGVHWNWRSWLISVLTSVNPSGVISKYICPVFYYCGKWIYPKASEKHVVLVKSWKYLHPFQKSVGAAINSKTTDTRAQVNKDIWELNKILSFVIPLAVLKIKVALQTYLEGIMYKILFLHTPPPPTSFCMFINVSCLGIFMWHIKSMVTEDMEKHLQRIDKGW
jgi:hypothetical protein